MPLLMAFASLGAHSATTAVAAKKPGPATVCLRSMEVSSLDAAAQRGLRDAVEVDLAKHGVHVALAASKRGRSACSARAARTRPGLLFLDLRALRVGPLVKMSAAFYRPAKRTPAIERKWSAEAAAILPSKELTRVLQKGALLARQLAGNRSREVGRTTPPVKKPPGEAKASGSEGKPAPPEKTAEVEKRTVDDPARHDPGQSQPIDGATSTPPDAAEQPVGGATSSHPDEGQSQPVDGVEAVERPLSPMFWASMVTMGVGAVGLGVGAGFGVKASIHEQAARDTEKPGSQLEIPRMEEAQDIANWSFLIGGTIAATGFVMWLFSDSETPATVAVGRSADGWVLSLSGRF